MASRTKIGLALFAAFVISTKTNVASAQLTIQQPVVGTNSVSTTVSVPDRGRAHLGSISRARDSRSRFGPFRSGSNIGLDREHTGMSVGVSIHDFQAMDEYLLNQASSRSESPAAFSPNARNAWSQLHRAHGSQAVQPASPARRPLDKSAKYWALGQRAEREGKTRVARLHYRIAVKYGSEAAAARLAALDRNDEAVQIAGGSE